MNKMNNNLMHVAIIMDGNGRWAKKNGMPIAFGHKQGAEVARKIIIASLKMKIPYLTLYTFSSENRNRHEDEVRDLMDLLRIYLSNELPMLIEYGIKVKVIGNRFMLPGDICNLIDECENKTKMNTALNLQIAIGYGGREEILNAQKRLCRDIISGKIKEQEITEVNFSNYLYTAGIPDPDLLIRTSGECRVSNFLLWQIAYTELYFSKVLWPDFNRTHFSRAVNNFYKRERRYGLSK